LIGSLEVSVIGLGCNNFGRSLDADESARVVHAALDAGMNYFDVASNYGGGQAESFLGAALAGRRGDVVIATKFGMPVAGVEGSGGASPEYVRGIVERSLSELGTDYIDLYQLHLPDPETPIEETLQVLDELVEQGTVREIGCSNMDTAQLAETLDASAENDLASFVSNQVHYSMVHREPEDSGLVELSAERGVAVLPYFPLASGLLTGSARRGETPQGRLGTDRYRRFVTEENFDLAERLEGFAMDRGLSMAEVAVGWLLTRDTVPAVTPGASTPEQVEINASAAVWDPTQEELKALESVVTG